MIDLFVASPTVIFNFLQGMKPNRQGKSKTIGVDVSWQET